MATSKPNLHFVYKDWSAKKILFFEFRQMSTLIVYAEIQLISKTRRL